MKVYLLTEREMRCLAFCLSIHTRHASVEQSTLNQFPSHLVPYTRAAESTIFKRLRLRLRLRPENIDVVIADSFECSPYHSLSFHTTLVMP